MVEYFSDLRFSRQIVKSRDDPFSFECSREKAEAYSRSRNPAVIALCRTLADMQEAGDCVVTSYGFGAILTLCLSQLKKGDHIIVAENCFGSHGRGFREYMKTSSIDVTYVDNDNFDQWQVSVCSTTRMAFMAPSVGLCTESQARKIRQLSTLLRETGFIGQDIQLVVDNTHDAAVHVQPLIHGADFVLYTSTKVLEAQGRAVAGAICGRKSQMASVAHCMNEARVCVSPFNAWAILRGLGAEDNRVLDHILGVGSKGGSDKVVSLKDKRHDTHRECVMP